MHTLPPLPTLLLLLLPSLLTATVHPIPHALSPTNLPPLSHCSPPASRCKPHLVCLNNVCQFPPAPLNAPCSLRTAHFCDSPWICAGPSHSRRCVTPLSPGDECNNGNPYHKCRVPYDCVDGVCKRVMAPIGMACGGDSPACAGRMVCAGPPDARRCVMPMAEGKPCRRDPYWVCANGLRCEAGVCRPRAPVGARCPEHGTCEGGKVCAGPTDNKRCVKPMGEGKACGIDPFWVCKPWLECKDQVCRHPAADIGGRCPEHGTCEGGKLCAGPTDNKRCVKPMGEGKACGIDPFWVCKPWLECVDKVCRHPAAPIGERCPGNGKCEGGKVCAGPTDNKRCVKPMGEGKACGIDPFWVCKPWLECVDKVCRHPAAPIGERCPEHGKCEGGKVCAGPSDNKKCVKPMGKGGACGIDPFWVCKPWLECVDKVCRHPAAPIGERCPGNGKCEGGQVCAGPSDNKKCVKPMGEGKACGIDPFWVCKPWLECVDNVCRHPAAMVGPRCPEHGNCEHGYVCAGPSDNKRCVKPMGMGKRCGLDPFWVCKTGLWCVDGVCRD